MNEPSQGHAVRNLVLTAWVASLGFDALGFVALMMAMGFAPGSSIVIVAALIGGALTPIVAAIGVLGLTRRRRRDPEARLSLLAVGVLLLLQSVGAMWLVSIVRL
jgi:uncharacterized membrane protein